MKLIKFTSYDNVKVIANVWDDVRSPKGIVILVHDLKENVKFYSKFAENLNHSGFIVCATNLRLHNKNSEEIIDENKDYFKENVNDQYILTKIMTESFNLPVIAIGIGFGASIVQRYLEICNFASIAILIGSGYSKSLILKTARPLGFALHVVSRKHNLAKQIERLIFAPFENKFTNKNYITTDEEFYENLLTDSIYTTLLPVNYYYSFLNNIVCKDKNLSNIDKNTKILFMSGYDDPVGNNGENTRKMLSDFKKAGLQATMEIFHDMRHNLIFEKNENQIYVTIKEFINKYI